jgi:putative CocE/NonD family hydrolase
MVSTRPVRDVHIEYDVEAPMRDGTVLRSTVYRAATAGRFPVLLSRTPYGRDAGIDPLYFDPLRAVRDEYVVVRQDVRGRYGSDGVFDPSHQEADDGYDTVQWAAGLPYCDGTVGMWGRSYFAETQWRAALTRPPALRAIVPGVSAAHEVLDGFQMRGGARELGSRWVWVHGPIGPDLIARRYAGDPAAGRRAAAGLLADLDRASNGDLLATLPLAELADPGAPTAALMASLAREVTDPEWERLRLAGRYDRVQVPAMHIGGWFDVFLSGTLGQYRATADLAAARGDRPPRLVIGPWTHIGVAGAAGQLDFGPTASGAYVDLTEQHLRWFDATLKGQQERLTGDPVQLFVMGENRWRGYPTYPVPDARAEEWYLQPGGGLDRGVAPGGAPDTYDYDPRDPAPTVGGSTLLTPALPAGPHDQRGVEARPDVLSYTSGVLHQARTVLGAVSVTLHAASSAPDTDFVARLVDVHPDGRAMNVADGIIRASARASYPEPGVVRPVPPTPIEPGTVYEYRIDLWATGLTFPAGHRIRVDITSSSHPRWDRNPNTGRSAYDSARTAVARQRIFHDPDRPSRITLTVVDR